MHITNCIDHDMGTTDMQMEIDISFFPIFFFRTDFVHSHIHSLLMWSLNVLLVSDRDLGRSKNYRNQ